MFGHDDLETEICIFLFITAVFDDLQALFIHHLNCNDYIGRENLATILNTSEGAITRAVKDLEDYLQSLAEGDREHDAMPALGTPRSAVQVMNLHKAKGLEAPVVFLVDPSGGEYEHPVSVHIDRSGKKSKGFLALHDPNQEFYPPELAVPAKWEQWEATEKKFQEAESNRLMYVATTRARDQLIVVHRESHNNRNLWKRLGQAVNDLKAEFVPPANVTPRAENPVQISDDEASHTEQQLGRRWAKALAPTYAVAGVKAISVGKKTVSAPGRQHGTEWGTVIHTLLEAAMVDGHADLRELATSVLREQGFDDPDDHLEAALETVRSVMASPLWIRARKSSRCLVEAPFQLPTTLPSSDGTPVTTILRGAIDLVFMEADQWVIADYKTDSVPRDQLPALVDHYKGQVEQYAQAWETITGGKVAGKGALFHSVGRIRDVLSSCAGFGPYSSSVLISRGWGGGEGG